MKVFLASLLAAAALASRPDPGFYYLIAEDSVNMREWDFDDATEEAEYTDYDNQLLTLETHQLSDETTTTFCFDVDLFDWDGEAEYTLFGVAWTNGEGYSDDAELNGLIARGTVDSGAWTWVMYDDIATAVAAETDTESAAWSFTDWSPINRDFECCCGGECGGTICATRDLVEDGYFDLPFVSGTEFVAYWSAGAFTGVEYSGAMSLGLALLSAAGAVLTLI